MSRKLVLNFIDSENLQPSMQDADPVKYYEAYQKLCSASGIIVPGGFGNRGVEGKIAAINWARTHNIPYLGICLGMQLGKGFHLDYDKSTCIIILMYRCIEYAEI